MDYIDVLIGGKKHGKAVPVSAYSHQIWDELVEEKDNFGSTEYTRISYSHCKWQMQTLDKSYREIHFFRAFDLSDEETQRFLSPFLSSPQAIKKQESE